LIVVITPVLVFVSDGNIAVAIAPVLLIGFVYALWKGPVRYPTLAVLFLGLAMEDPANVFAAGLWETPLHAIRALFFLRWNLVMPVPPLVFSGMDLTLVLILAIALYRRATRSRIDGYGVVDTASPVRFFFVTTLAGALLSEAWGALQGGMVSRFAFIQMQHVIYPILYFFLYHYSFRGPQDHPAIAKTVIAAACIRAATAFGIRHLVDPHDYDRMTVATTHGDSILFAGAFCLCVVMAIEMRDKKRLKVCAFVLPILVMGMVANNRRLVWVQIAEGLLTLFFIIPTSRLKRKAIRRALAVIPALGIYVAAGWDSAGGALFSGARVMRSLVDSDTNGSTKWRDWENFDLVTTLHSSPVLGVGFGHPFLQPFDVARDIPGYDLEPYQPHNSLLGLWAFGGIVGFTLLWMIVVVSTFLAVRSYRRATRPEDRAAALAVVTMVVVYIASCYGDVGYSELDSKLLIPLAFCVAGKLALVTGAWPSKSSPAVLPLSTGG
jgi:O-antigen ligase